MGHKKEESGLDALFEVFKHVRAWVGPLFAAISFMSIRYCAPILLPKPTTEADISTILRPIAPVLSWIVGGAILLAWIMAEIYKLSNRRLFDRTRDIDNICNLSWHEFERFVTESYRRQGYQAKHVGAPSGDGGIDILLHGHGEKVIVQCKQWKAFKVGVSPVRELLGVITSEKADRGILVTSGRFTPEAIRFGKRNGQLELVDGGRLASIISEVQKNRSAAEAPRTARPSQPLQEPPPCPYCGTEMVLRTAKKGQNVGLKFWGCPNYPACRGTNAMR